MNKPKVNLFRLMFAAVIGAAIYMLLMQFMFKSGWRFDITNRVHWQFAWNKWNRGWVIKETKDVLFFCLLLSFFPGWIISTFLAYSFPYKDFFLFPVTLYKNYKRRKLLRQSLALANGNGKKSTSTTASSKKKQPPYKSNPVIDKLRGRQVVSTSASKASSDSAEEAPASVPAPSKTFEELQLEHLQRWNDIATDLEESNIFCFRSTKVGSFTVKLTVLTKDTIFWFIEGPLQPRTWTLKDDAPLNSVWVSADESIPSPLRQTYEARQRFLNYLSEHSPYAKTTIHAFVVMDSGKLKNTDKIATDLAEWDVAVLKMPPCEDDTLSDFETVLNYIKKQKASDMEFNDSVAETIMALEDN